MDEGEQAAAETWALEALSQAFSMLGDEDKGKVFNGPSASVDNSDGPYTVVNEVRPGSVTW